VGEPAERDANVANLAVDDVERRRDRHQRERERRALAHLAVPRARGKRKCGELDRDDQLVALEHRVALLTWVLSSAIVVVVLFTPTYLQKVHHVPAALSLEANAVATLMLTLGCILVGWASDKIGTRVVMLVGWVEDISAGRRPSLLPGATRRVAPVSPAPAGAVDDSLGVPEGSRARLVRVRAHLRRCGGGDLGSDHA
jgi:hypothetical protein